MTYKYREMNIVNYDKFISLWEENPGIGVSDADSKENIKQFLTRNKGLSFVCLIDGSIIGTILCGHDGRRGYIYHIFVHEAHRRNGIAEKLATLSLEQLKIKGIDKCHIYAFSKNTEAMKFWEKIGWQKRDDLIMFSRMT